MASKDYKEDIFTLFFTLKIFRKNKFVLDLINIKVLQFFYESLT